MCSSMETFPPRLAHHLCNVALLSFSVEIFPLRADVSQPAEQQLIVLLFRVFSAVNGAADLH